MTERDYYDYHVRLMDTDVGFHEVRKLDAYDRPYPPGPYGIDDDKTGKRWKLDGTWIGPVLDKADIEAMLDTWGATEGDCVYASVEDNGELGDGLFLCFTPSNRVGDHKSHPDKWGDNRSDKSPALLFGIRLTARQAAILGAALSGVAAMRIAQGEEK